MKPNPCKRCGNEPNRCVYGGATSRRISFDCSCKSDVYVVSEQEHEAILVWNAMNPLPKSDKCGPMPVDEAEFAKGIAKQADVIEKLRASDCPIESQEPVEQTCGNCHYFRANMCRRYAPMCLTFEAIPNMPQSASEAVWPIVSASGWCGEWRAK